MRLTIFIIILFLSGLGVWGYSQRGVSSPRGQEKIASSADISVNQISERTVSVTDGAKHSIPLGEILSGGPPKDGIPSIDHPQFIKGAEANALLRDEDAGIGLVVRGEKRFYPYRILVWHEIVNDTVQGMPVLVTYCPLCATGIVYERMVSGAPQEFGVSGKLWQSNLLMYNRASQPTEESLWSQVLGEAVVGVHTGEKLSIVPSDIVRWGEWQKLYPDTKALSSKTGTLRNYGQDSYGDYYTSESVSFGASFRDTRLHSKALVAGITLGGAYKAYHMDALRVGETTDAFAGKVITLRKDAAGRLVIEADGERVPHVPSFWFSWLAVHPGTELYYDTQQRSRKE
ncbi:MAG: DUF3179 domain-containing protein [Candidatus Liptonbacteria bacterium]|nr:DUF3179 domain-containing protein [Candidatus Liptonbacteria bacterium]